MHDPDYVTTLEKRVESLMAQRDSAMAMVRMGRVDKAAWEAKLRATVEQAHRECDEKVAAVLQASRILQDRMTALSHENRMLHEMLDARRVIESRIIGIW